MTPPASNVIRCLRSALGDAEGGPADATLLHRFATSRDAEAFELLVWRHAGMVLRVCRSRLRDHHAAEDASQAVFLALAKQAGAVCRRGTVAGWLYRVAWRIAARAAQKPPPQLINDLDSVFGRETPVQDPALMQALHEEIARLPEKHRVPILLCFFEGLSQTDAAKRLGWPIGTIATRITRGKQMLHRRLSIRGVAIPAAGLGVLIVADTAPAFVSSTVSAAIAFVSGKGAGVVPVTILHLAQGAIRTMTLTKIRWAAGIAAACGVMAFGAAWAASGLDERPIDPPPAAAASAPAGAAENVGAKPTVRTANSEQRKRSLENLKILVLAMQNYEAAYGCLPSDIRDKDGKPLLSWRVALLPFLEQDALHRQFKLSESWDSEHNLKLLAKMPDVLRLGFEPKDATHTHYQVFVGLDTPFGPTRQFADGPAGGSGGGPPPGIGTGASSGPPGTEGVGSPKESIKQLPVKLTQISDGTSNTFAVVEAGPPVAWSKPADIAWEASKLPRTEWPFANSIHVSVLDGNAFAIKPDVDPKTLAIFIRMNDGLVAPPMKTLQARLPVETDADRVELKRLVEGNEKLIIESERLLKEQMDLLRGLNSGAKEFTQVEALTERLKQMIAELTLANRTLRKAGMEK